MTTPSPSTMAVLRSSFPEGLDPEALFPPGTELRPIGSPGDLDVDPGFSSVVAYSDASTVADCPAFRFLRTLRVSRTLPEKVRSIPVAILSPQSLETLLRGEPQFLAFVSPGTGLVRLPCPPDDLAGRITDFGPADSSTLADYFDLAGRLALLRHQARHDLANALGPRVLIQSAAASGALSVPRLVATRARIDRGRPPSERVE
jgi:hypothetical protein